MVKMMVTVVGVFTICWLPYNILIVLIFVESISDNVVELLYFPFHGLAMSHACYNPIIYCYMNSRFRDGLNQILRSVPCCRRYYSKGTTGSGPPSAGIEATESALINRKNTYSTYVSLKRKNRLNASSSGFREPVRSNSVRTNTSIAFSRKSRCSMNLMDEQI